MKVDDFKDESESKIINEFNKEYETSLLIPIVYNPADDLVLLENNFHSNLIYKPYRQFNFANFKNIYKSKGVNFYLDGVKSRLDKGTATTIFNRLDSETRLLLDSKLKLHM